MATTMADSAQSLTYQFEAEFVGIGLGEAQIAGLKPMLFAIGEEKQQETQHAQQVQSDDQAHGDISVSHVERCAALDEIRRATGTGHKQFNKPQTSGFQCDKWENNAQGEADSHSRSPQADVSGGGPLDLVKEGNDFNKQQGQGTDKHTKGQHTKET